MPRVNLSIGQELYENIAKKAKNENKTVNYLIYELLEKEYGDHSSYDYSEALNNLIVEAKDMEKEFTLADLQTFAGVEEILVEIESKESAAAVRARLGKLFNEAVKRGVIPGVKRSTIEQNGNQTLKFSSRAAVYSNSSNSKAKKSKI